MPERHDLIGIAGREGARITAIGNDLHLVEEPFSPATVGTLHETSNRTR